VKTGDEEAMEKMHYAGTFAGVAMTNSGLGLAHGIGHSISALFHIPHGAATGFALPYTIEFCARTSSDRYVEILRALGVGGVSTDNAAQKLSSMIKEFMIKIQITPTLKGIGVSEDGFRKTVPKLAEFSENDVTSITSPRNASTEDFTRIFEYMLKNKSIDF
jgi:alcohol dehydrogenase class IV